MKQTRWLSILTLLLCAAVLISGIGVTVYALQNTEPPKDSPTSSPESTSTSSEKAKKDETVYVLANADGTVQKIIVSDWIQNTQKQAELEDRTELSGVETVKGDESYTINGEHTRIWNAQGNDIYYRGDLEKELPVSISVRYLLDGKEQSPAELAGKSGTLTIRFSYTNHCARTVKIDGKEETIYVPFAMLTGLLLDNDVCSNVTVSGGKLLNDGDRTIVIGVALPGLQSNLGIDRETLEIPEQIEITADVRNFEMANTVTIATNGIFNRLDLSKVNSPEDLKTSLNTLTEAVTQLSDGSSRLYDGLCTLLEKSDELIRGIDQLAAGAEQLKAGASDLTSSAGSLATGAATLADGLNALQANNGTLNAGAKQVFESLLKMADAQLAAAGLTVPQLTIETYSQTLQAVMNSLSEETIRKQAQEAAYKQVAEAVRAQEDTIRAAVTEAVHQSVETQVTEAIRKQILTQLLATQNLTPETYEAAIAAGTIPEAMQVQIEQTMQQQLASQTVQATIAQTVERQMQSDPIRETIATQTDEQISLLITQNLESDDVKALIQAAIAKAQAGAASIRALQEQLDSYRAFYLGLQQYTAGVASAANGAGQISEGASALQTGAASLQAGMNTLYNGILALQNGCPALTDGISQLRDGAMQLSNGMQQFREQGVQKLLDVVNGDFGSLLARLRATVDVSNAYRSFSGISDDMDGQVKFIYRTDAIRQS